MKKLRIYTFYNINVKLPFFNVKNFNNPYRLSVLYFILINILFCSCSNTGIRNMDSISDKNQVNHIDIEDQENNSLNTKIIIFKDLSQKLITTNPKYIHLKQELLNNSFSRTSLDEWNSSLKLCEEYKNTNFEINNLVNEYWRKDINIESLISLMFYFNVSNLQKEFSKTFLFNYPEKEIIKRNQELYYLKKLLFEGFNSIFKHSFLMNNSKIQMKNIFERIIFFNNRIDLTHNNVFNDTINFNKINYNSNSGVIVKLNLEDHNYDYIDTFSLINFEDEPKPKVIMCDYKNPVFGMCLSGYNKKFLSLNFNSIFNSRICQIFKILSNSNKYLVKSEQYQLLKTLLQLYRVLESNINKINFFSKMRLIALLPLLKNNFGKIKFSEEVIKKVLNEKRNCKFTSREINEESFLSNLHELISEI